MKAWVKYAESALTITRHERPAARVVARARASSRADPLGEDTFPRRSFTAAITGAASGVESTASWALSPFTPE